MDRCDPLFWKCNHKKALKYQKEVANQNHFLDPNCYYYPALVAAAQEEDYHQYYSEADHSELHMENRVHHMEQELAAAACNPALEEVVVRPKCTSVAVAAQCI